MEEALKVLNDLKQKGTIGDYAIAGAMAAIFYTEPFFTKDLDILAVLPETPTGLVILEPIYSRLREMGYEVVGEHINIGRTLVQFIAGGDALHGEALKKSVPRKYGEMRTKVVLPEHLIAIWLRSDRPKDRPKIRVLLDQVEVNMEYLQDILQRHDLREKWMDFEARYL